MAEHAEHAEHVSSHSDTLQNDQFFISHKHQQEDGLPNLEEIQEKEVVLDDDASTASVVRSPPATEKRDGTLVFSAGVCICPILKRPDD